MATKQIEIPNVGTVVLCKRQGNRSIRLSIAPNGEVRVSMPSWLPYKAGERFAIARAGWIAEHQNETPRLLQHGQAVGKAHRLYFNRSIDALKITSRIKQNQIEITHPSNLTHQDKEVQKAANTAGIRGLRKEAQQLLPYRLKQIAEHRGFTYKSVDIKQLKSRWGSCSSQQEIILNLYLMQLPWHLIDYVILHELTHTKVMQHGMPFWQELERHLPNAKTLRKEIGQYHTVLTAGLPLTPADVQ